MKIQFVSDLHLEFSENRAYLAEHPLDVTGDASSVDVNAWEQHTYGCLNHVTLYPSPYMVLSNKGYTNVTEVESRASSLALPRCSNVTERKHYYAGTDLCASREQSQACLSYAEMQQSVQSNHLGSASWITDSAGVAIQHIQYLPYGEPYINQRAAGTTYSERFRFTGKDPRKGDRAPVKNITYQSAIGRGQTPTLHLPNTYQLLTNSYHGRR